MSRAFIDEDSEALLNREIIEHERKLRDWLRIQEKKLAFLESDPKVDSMDQALRMKWVLETRADIERTRKTLEDLASPGTGGAEVGDAG
ncbi:MAG: hypothetical protein Q7I97_00770 [Thermovirgaceae bacterium]|nr:hypothetical protein [Thermovirgaceae bacterium]